MFYDLVAQIVFHLLLCTFRSPPFTFKFPLSTFIHLTCLYFGFAFQSRMRSNVTQGAKLIQMAPNVPRCTQIAQMAPQGSITYHSGPFDSVGDISSKLVLFGPCGTIFVLLGTFMVLSGHLGSLGAFQSFGSIWVHFCKSARKVPKGPNEWKGPKIN